MSDPYPRDQIAASVVAEVEYAKAQQDLVDIKELEKQPAFSRYFLRRIRESRDKLVTAITDGVSTDNYAIHVAKIKFAKEILSFIENDKMACKKMLNTEDVTVDPVPSKLSN